MLECWCVAVFDVFDLLMLFPGCWNIGILTCVISGILELWKCGIVFVLNFGMLDCVELF